MSKRKLVQEYNRSLDSIYDESPTRITNRGVTRSSTKGMKKPTNVVALKPFSKRNREVIITPKSTKQEEYVDHLLNPESMIVFATGPAGTGKTMLAVLAAVKAYKDGEIDRIIITRPAIEVDNERLGFLPGDLNEKMAPWTRPIFDVMKEYYSPSELATMLRDETIEISPLAFMRGRSFSNAFIIADEMQNASPSQLKMLLTRIGYNCRLIVTGDTRQTDRKGESNGLIDFQKRSDGFNGHKFIFGVEFTGVDIQRHPAVEEVLKIYGDL